MALFGDDDKTEQPTGRRLEDARKKGQIARSARAPRAATLAAALGVFGFMGSSIVARLTGALETSLATLGDRPLQPIGDGQLVNLFVDQARVLVLVVGPLAIA